MNVYTHLGYEDAAELIRMVGTESAQREQGRACMLTDVFLSILTVSIVMQVLFPYTDISRTRTITAPGARVGEHTSIGASDKRRLKSR